MGPVLCHGDFHMWNVAFDSESDSGVRFFDFQVSHQHQDKISGIWAILRLFLVLEILSPFKELKS